MISNLFKRVPIFGSFIVAAALPSSKMKVAFSEPMNTPLKPHPILQAELSKSLEKVRSMDPKFLAADKKVRTLFSISDKPENDRTSEEKTMLVM